MSNVQRQIIPECSQQPIEHGGDLARARRAFPHAPEPWIDLSTGINPHAYPVGDLPSDCLTRLPDAAALEALEQAAASAYGAAAHEIVAAPGAQALIQMLPRILPGARVGVLGPTYAEHALAWRRAGREAVACAAAHELAACDIGVIVNPNNPDGRTLDRATLLGLARRTQLVVDESFCDFTPEVSIAPLATACGALVLRSFGKTYGLAGLRLGFAIGAPSLVTRLRSEFGPWAVSGPAIAVGRRALEDRAWLARTGAQLAAESERLDALLRGAAFEIVGGTRLFRLARSATAQEAAQALGRAGVHVRRFADFPDFLRFGLPPADGWGRLAAALGVRSEKSA